MVKKLIRKYNKQNERIRKEIQKDKFGIKIIKAQGGISMALAGPLGLGPNLQVFDTNAIFYDLRNVRNLQENLVKGGYLDNTYVDGILGTKTHSALQAALANQGYLEKNDIDGKWGDKSRNAYTNYVTDYEFGKYIQNPLTNFNKKLLNMPLLVGVRDIVNNKILSPITNALGISKLGGVGGINTITENDLPQEVLKRLAQIVVKYSLDHNINWDNATEDKPIKFQINGNDYVNNYGGVNGRTDGLSRFFNLDPTNEIENTMGTFTVLVYPDRIEILDKYDFNSQKRLNSNSIYGKIRNAVYDNNFTTREDAPDENKILHSVVLKRRKNDQSRIQLSSYNGDRNYSYLKQE